jgi:hypothetical protein
MNKKDEVRTLLYQIKMNRLQRRGAECQALLSKMIKEQAQ